MSTSALPQGGFVHDFALPPGSERSTFHVGPRSFIDKKGEAIVIRPLDERIAPRLIDMYLAFRPRPCFQGLPPIRDEVCTRWVRGMIADAINLVALSAEQGVVGHTGVFPMDDVRCEMLVVVSPRYQNMGIGTELVRCSIQLAYEIGFAKVWLPVESTNVRARHVYKKCGFDYLLPGQQAREVEMALDLKRYRDAAGAPKAQITRGNVPIPAEDEPCRAAQDRMVRPVAAS